MPRAVFSTAAAFALWAGAASAQALTGAVELCSDPLTDGPAKLDLLPAYGWQPAEPDLPVLTDLSTALIIGFTGGMPDLEDRFSRAPILAGNFAQLIEEGQVTLWSLGEAVLAVSIAQTPEGTEHFACYFASPPSDETMSWMERYGTPEVLPDLELIAMRFDETAFAFDPDRTYQMISSWTRLTSDPARGPFTDGYRLERIEEPPLE